VSSTNHGRAHGADIELRALDRQTRKSVDRCFRLVDRRRMICLVPARLDHSVIRGRRWLLPYAYPTVTDAIRRINRPPRCEKITAATSIRRARTRFNYTARSRPARRCARRSGPTAAGLRLSGTFRASPGPHPTARARVCHSDRLARERDFRVCFTSIMPPAMGRHDAQQTVLLVLGALRHRAVPAEEVGRSVPDETTSRRRCIAPISRALA